MNNELLPCPFKDCDGMIKYEEDDYNHGYLCPKCEGWLMPCLKPLDVRADKAAHVERIEGLSVDDVKRFNNEHINQKWTIEGGMSAQRVTKAALAYLALQGGE